MITKKFLHTFNLLGPQMYVPSLKSIDEIAWDIFFASICLRSNVWHGICKISFSDTLTIRLVSCRCNFCFLFADRFVIVESIFIFALSRQYAAGSVACARVLILIKTHTLNWWGQGGGWQTMVVAQLPQKLLIFITSNCGNRAKI